VLEAATGTGGETNVTGTVEEVLAAVAAAFLGWQLTMALYGFLNGITFAGQPAVEDYKARARALRVPHPAGGRAESPLDAVAESGVAISGNGLTMLCPPGAAAGTPEGALATALGHAGLCYVDLTINGRSHQVADGVLPAVRRLALDVLRVPLKPREAAAAYHSTEQSEMDGPDGLVSIRLVARQHERVLLGRYDDRFLLAQAAGTWQAMVEKGRMCFLLIADDEVTLPRGATSLFNGVAKLLSKRR
jgi:hypothetical protein